MSDGGSHGSNGSKRLRAFVAILCVVLPFGPSLIAGCGSSSAAPVQAAPTATITADATVPLVMVVTAGGGAGSSSGAMIVNPFGGSSSGSSSGSSGTGSDGGPETADAGDGGGDGAALPEAAPPNVCPGMYMPPTCGVASDGTPVSCDLRSNTCCVNFSLTARCIPGLNAACASNEATIHCTQGCECSGGDVCCGVENTILGVVQTVCQSVPDGGFCRPYPQTATQASAQICSTDDECKNGQSCIKQTCIYGAMLNVCGLQSQDPFDCMPVTTP
jgi:hypothetical protein